MITGDSRLRARIFVAVTIALSAIVMGGAGVRIVESIASTAGSTVLALAILALVVGPLGPFRKEHPESSASFVVLLAALLLVGMAWASIVAAVVTAIHQYTTRRKSLEAAFNTAQETLAISAAGISYYSLGGVVSRSTTAPRRTTA